MLPGEIITGAPVGGRPPRVPDLASLISLKAAVGAAVINVPLVKTMRRRARALRCVRSYRWTTSAMNVDHDHRRSINGHEQPQRQSFSLTRLRSRPCCAQRRQRTGQLSGFESTASLPASPPACCATGNPRGCRYRPPPCSLRLVHWRESVHRSSRSRSARSGPGGAAAITAGICPIQRHPMPSRWQSWGCQRSRGNGGCWRSMFASGSATQASPLAWMSSRQGTASLCDEQRSRAVLRVNGFC